MAAVSHGTSAKRMAEVRAALRCNFRGVRAGLDATGRIQGHGTLRTKQTASAIKILEDVRAAAAPRRGRSKLA
jgi:hypothetical protein